MTSHAIRSHLPLALAAGLVALAGTGCFRVSSDLGALRDSAMHSAAAKWDQQIEVGVGPVTLAMARVGLKFVDLEPDARTALHAVRGAEVGVYRRHGKRAALPRAAILSAADAAMNERGWDRVVGVLDGRDLVAVYVPQNSRATRSIKVCLLVLNPEEMVVASARSNLEPLMELASRHMEHGNALRSRLSL